MPKPKIISQCCVHNLYSNSNEVPAEIADVGLVTTGTDLVVICQIYIEDELLAQWAEGSFA